MSSGSSRRLYVAGIACLVIGLGLVAISYLLPQLDTGQGAWSNQQAQELQQTAARIHELSSPTAVQRPEDRNALAEAQQRHDALNQQRSDAIAAARWRVLVVRWSGAVLALIGLGLNLAGRDE